MCSWRFEWWRVDASEDKKEGWKTGGRGWILGKGTGGQKGKELGDWGIGLKERGLER